MGGKVIQGSVIIVAIMFFLSFATFTEAVAGGKKAKPGEFPHAVQLSYKKTGEYFCGGSIIAPKVILTAAHCCVKIRNFEIHNKSPESILVTAGTLTNLEGSLDLEKEGQSLAVGHFHKHPEFDYSYGKNDIALLFLEKSLIYNDKVQPVQLPPPNAIFPSGTLAGWGITDGRNVASPYLKKIQLDFEDPETCNRDPLMKMKPAELKASSLDVCTIWSTGSSSCKGDSGSSVTCQRSATALKNNTGSLPPTICGIVSWGKSRGPCGESQKVAVFAEVSQYLDWIQDTIEAHGFGNLMKPLTCSESEGFFDCGEFGLDGEKIKSRCILIEKKCDGVNNCGNGRDENVCVSTPAWLWVFVTFTTLILIGTIMVTAYLVWNRYRSQNQDFYSSQV